MSQVILKFESGKSDFSRESFFASESNAHALAYVEKWPDWQSHCLIISGAKGCGKTHLAHIWQNLSGAEFLSHDFVIEDRMAKQDYPIYIVEDIERLKNEAGLLHLYNLVKEKKGGLLLTAAQAPKDLPINLPDLRSRLNSSPSVFIAQPDDELLRTILTKLFAERQLRVGREVYDYLLPRMQRSFTAAEELVNELDNSSMKSKRNITIPLARTVIGSN